MPQKTIQYSKLVKCIKDKSLDETAELYRDSIINEIINRVKEDIKIVISKDNCEKEVHIHGSLTIIT